MRIALYIIVFFIKSTFTNKLLLLNYTINVDQVLIENFENENNQQSNNVWRYSKW